MSPFVWGIVVGVLLAWGVSLIALALLMTVKKPETDDERARRIQHEMIDRVVTELRVEQATGRSIHVAHPRAFIYPEQGTN